MSKNPYENMNAFFTNTSKEKFIVNWNSTPHSFEAGETKKLPAWFAEHCAKHLVNKQLLAHGNPNFESYTSPKKPEDVPEFMNRFNACFKLIGSKDPEVKKDALMAEIELLNGEDEDEKPEAAPEKVEEAFEDEDEKPEAAPEKVEEEKKVEETANRGEGMLKEEVESTPEPKKEETKAKKPTQKKSKK